MPTPPFDDNSQLRLHASHSLARGASSQLSWREAYKTAAPRGRIFLIIHNIGSWLLCPCGRGGLFGFFSSARYLTDTNGGVFLFLVLFSVFLSCHQCGKRYSGESGGTENLAGATSPFPGSTMFGANNIPGAHTASFAGPVAPFP